ncbi:unnamed protein product [Agarophyton chilense]
MKSEACENWRMTPDQVANELLELMQQSGQRDRIKEWLINDLETTGWTATLFEKAAQLDSPKPRDEKSASENSSEIEASSTPQSEQLTVRRISSQLQNEALASVPESVRSKLMQELLDVTRQYIATESLARNRVTPDDSNK